MRLLALAIVPAVLTGSVAAQDSNVANRAVPGALASRSGTFEGANLEVGGTAAYKMLTHCGVESVKIDEAWWNAVTPLYGHTREGADPPADWAEPWQNGELTLETAERAVFAALGEQVVLQRSPSNEPLRICR